MIEVKVVEGEFLVKGSFAFGIAGTYVNEDFGDDKIQITDSYDELIDDYTEEPYSWWVLEPYLEGKELNEENVSNAISEYYNALEKKAQECIKQINNNFLINVFSNMVDCGNEFWEIEGAFIKEKMPNCSEDDYSEVIYEPYWDKINEIYEEYEETPNDNSLQKTDVEEKLREMFPMFNMDGLIKGVVAEHFSLNGKYVSFQCSDSWGYEILCGAYDELDENFVFTDWHNF